MIRTHRAHSTHSTSLQDRCQVQRGSTRAQNCLMETTTTHWSLLFLFPFPPSGQSLMGDGWKRTWGLNVTTPIRGGEGAENCNFLAVRLQSQTSWTTRCGPGQAREIMAGKIYSAFSCLWAIRMFRLNIYNPDWPMADSGRERWCIRHSVD